VVEDYAGRVFFIPGNHDWDHIRIDGPEAVQRQEAFIESYLGRGDVFVPNDGFPGPTSIKLTDDIRLLALDTQWWLTDRENKPYGDTGEYDLDEDADVLIELNDLIRRYDDEHVLVVGHHPMRSNGEHAGFFPARTHLFPLTELWKNAYIPLPVLGTMVPLYIRYVGSRQDLAHPRYKSLRGGLERVFATHESLIYASGHDHNLQLFETQGPEPHQHYIVSGSGSKHSATAHGRGEIFAHGAQGFMTLYYYQDGSVWVEAWAPEGDGSTGLLRFRTELEPTRRDAVDPELPTTAAATYPDYSDSTFVVAANPGYQAGAVKTFLWGSHNRDVWGIPVQVPYLDLGHEAGGLTPVKRGGGQQTFSLRLEGQDGVEYVIRSVDKDPSVSVPENLRGTLVTEIVQDQIASIHPYGAYIVPKLAAAAGVMHTSPRLVYVPRDPRLGTYLNQFGGQLMMFEERPDGKMEGWSSYQEPDDIISPAALYREIDSDNDHRVDQRAFVRTRLFDMLLSDWDRHRNQWRWAAYEPHDKEGKIYRPIPRDRDWAFNRFNGLLPALTRTFFDPKFQEFSPDYGYIKGLTRNGLEQDRRLTAELDREAWLSIADSLSRELTDAGDHPRGSRDR
jgi:hypothetical protein